MVATLNPSHSLVSPLSDIAAPCDITVVSKLETLTHGFMANADSSADERLWMYMITVDEAKDVAQRITTVTK